MRYLVLAAFAAAAVIAFLGTGSASATVLCEVENKENEACGGKHYPVETVLQAVLAEGSKSILNGFWTDVECGKSEMTAKITKAGGVLESVRASVQALTFEECICAGGEGSAAQV